MSSAPVIEIHQLHKEYRRLGKPPTVAIDQLDLVVPAGGVFGFLGPNGSGKTTTIRCLLGLARPTRGTCRLLGAAAPAQLPTVLARVSAIVETPALFPNFSGRQNLELLAGLYRLPATRITHVLAQVGLADRADDRTKNYSLGMRQRLGLAAALLKDPTLLILDEPANGLDPAGMVEMRHLLRALADEGRTVFVSSHLLGELQLICDRVAILSRGRCVANGTIAEVLAGGRTGLVTVRVDPDEVAIATMALTFAHFRCRPSTDPEVIVVEAKPETARHINQELARHDIWIHDLRSHPATLEDVFLDLTGTPQALTDVPSRDALTELCRP